MFYKDKFLAVNFVYLISDAFTANKFVTPYTSLLVVVPKLPSQTTPPPPRLIKRSAFYEEDDDDMDAGGSHYNVNIRPDDLSFFNETSVRRDPAGACRITLYNDIFHSGKLGGIFPSLIDSLTY